MANLTRNNAKQSNAWFGTLDQTIDYLMECKSKGESVYVDFNGKKLYSADITVDGAYLLVTGVTKAEMDQIDEEMDLAPDREARSKIHKKYDELKERHIEEQKKSAPQLKRYFNSLDEAIEYLMKCNNEGESIYVDFNGKKLYSADITVDGAYLLVTGVTKAEMDKIDEEMDLATNREEEKEVLKKYAELRQSHIEEQKKNAQQLKRYFSSLDEAIEYLMQCNSEGESVFVDFNGHKLYSADITVDGAYKEVTGKTKEEFDRLDEESYSKQQKDYEAKLEVVKSKIEVLKKKAESIVYPEKLEMLCKELDENAEAAAYMGLEYLDVSFDIMEKLKNGMDMDEVKKIYSDYAKDLRPGDNSVRYYVLKYSDRGPDFYESTATSELTDEEQRDVSLKRKENEELAILHQYSPKNKDNEPSAQKECEKDNVGSEERRREEKEIIELQKQSAECKSKISELDEQISILKQKEKKLKEKDKSNDENELDSK